MPTRSPKSWMWLMCAILCGPAYGQNNFTWQNSTIGGGGYCLEVRFAPYNIFWSGNNPALFLATDVSGLYRSYDYGNAWQRFENLYAATSEQNIPGRYITSIGFTTQGATLVAGTLDGIFCGPANGQYWLAAWMPQRDNLPADLQGKMAEYNDGRYPRISLVRENLQDPQFMLAGIGDLRERAKHVQTGQKDRTNFGLGALFREEEFILTAMAQIVYGGDAKRGGPARPRRVSDRLPCVGRRLHAQHSQGFCE